MSKKIKGVDKQLEFFQTLPTYSDHWRKHLQTRNWSNDYSKCTHGVLLGSTDNLQELTEAAKAAGIPENKWNELQSENDYSDCYYEGDTPKLIWVFPLTVFIN